MPDNRSLMESDRTMTDPEYPKAPLDLIDDLPTSRAVRPIPVDLDDGEGRELVNAITPIVRLADEQHQTEGGGTRHWVRDYFLPRLREAGYTVTPYDHQDAR